MVLGENSNNHTHTHTGDGGAGCSPPQSADYHAVGAQEGDGSPAEEDTNGDCELNLTEHSHNLTTHLTAYTHHTGLSLTTHV